MLMLKYGEVVASKKIRKRNEQIKEKKKQEKWKKRVRENSDDGVVQNDDTTWESDKNYVN